MVSTPLTVRPGINTQATPLLNEAGFSSSNLIRFKDGLLQKLGGWQKFFPTAVNGVCRGMFANQDLNGNQYLALGTNVELQVYINSVLSDITPVESVVGLTGPFTTVMNSSSVTVEDTGTVAQEGSGITIVTPTTIGGIILQGFYIVQSVTDADHFTIEAATPAVSSDTGGATALFTTSNGSETVQVTFANHGLSEGSPFTVYVSTTVGGVDIFGTYVVDTVIDTDNFEISVTPAAGSDDTGSENGGDVEIQYLLAAGNISAMNSSGYGIGYYGFGYFGYGASSSALVPPRQWHFGAWGEDLIANPTDLGIYIWLAAGGAIDNPATLISEAPDFNTSVFIAMPQQQIVALGAEVGSVQDPLLVRWCEVADYTDWTASPTNQAGSFRIPSGSRIVGGVQGPQQGLIWTDTSLWAMQYVQPPFVYGFNAIGSGCGLIGSRAMGTLNSRVFWMGTNGFYIYSGGGVVTLPCSVWDVVFQNLNMAQAEKITCAPNSSFNEITWYYPSNSGDGEVDSYAKYNADNNVWDYGTLVRTAWIDQSIFGQPMGVDGSGYVQQHEVSNDADDQPLVCFAETGLFKISEGLIFLFLERMIPDFVLSDGATVEVTVSVYDYPHNPPQVLGPFFVTADTPYIIIRARGRLASIRVASADSGSFWRLGEILQEGSSAGRR